MGQIHSKLIGDELHIARTGVSTGSPIGVVTPGIIGELYWDSAANSLYVAEGLTDADWFDLGSKLPAFLELTDTPATYAGQAGLSLQVNPGASALEFGQALRAVDSPTFSQLTVSSGLVVGSSTPFSDSAGVLILQNVDALDVLTEATIKDAIDTLANLTSIQSQAISLLGSLTVESTSILNQDLTTDANPTFNDLVLTGNLTVQGTTVTLDATTLLVEDKNIELGKVAAPTDLTADGGGITLKGTTDKTILWKDSTDSWDFNQAVRTGNLQLDANTLSSTNTNGDITLSPNGTGIVDIGSNVFVNDGFALVIGHTTQITVGSAAKFQVLGTGGSDSAIIVGRWQDNAFAPKISFAKSRGTTIGASAIVNDNDMVGLLRFCPDDGVGFTTFAAQFGARVDDASPAVGDIGMAFTWDQMDGEGGVLRETMRLAAKGNLGIGVVPNVNRQLDLGGIFNGNTRFSVTDILQSSGEAQQVFIGGTINSVANVDAHGVRIAPTLVEAGSGTHNNFDSLTIVPPVVTVGAASLNNATTLKISGEPTGATNNRALWVSAGRTELTGELEVGGNLGFFGTTPIAQETSVAITVEAIHAVLVNYGLITA